MKRSFLFDLGFHHGEELEYLTKQYGVDATWVVFCFEPNPACRVHLLRAGFLRNPRYTAMPFAAHVHTGPVMFQQEAVIHGGTEDGQGSHLADINLDIDCRGGRCVPVWAVDFPAFLRSIIPPVREQTAYVVVKMDIEGAEYELLRTMLQDGSLGLIDVLHVEFHQRLMPYETDATTEQLRESLRQFVRLEEHW